MYIGIRFISVEYQTCSGQSPWLLYSYFQVGFDFVLGLYASPHQHTLKFCTSSFTIGSLLRACSKQRRSQILQQHSNTRTKQPNLVYNAITSLKNQHWIMWIKWGRWDHIYLEVLPHCLYSFGEIFETVVHPPNNTNPTNVETHVYHAKETNLLSQTACFHALPNHGDKGQRQKVGKKRK